MTQQPRETLQEHESLGTALRTPVSVGENAVPKPEVSTEFSAEGVEVREKRRSDVRRQRSEAVASAERTALQLGVGILFRFDLGP